MHDVVLKEIGDGVKGMLKSQAALESRVGSIEDYLNDKKNLGGISLPGLKEEKSKFSFMKACAAVGLRAMGQTDAFEKLGAGFELEVLSQTTRKALDTGTGGSG